MKTAVDKGVAKSRADGGLGLEDVGFNFGKRRSSKVRVSFVNLAVRRKRFSGLSSNYFTLRKAQKKKQGLLQRSKRLTALQR